MEKLANHIALQSIAEGGMEKQALNLASLLRMSRNAAKKGKLRRFSELLNKRNLAIDNVAHVRRNAERQQRPLSIAELSLFGHGPETEKSLKLFNRTVQADGDPVAINRVINFRNGGPVDDSAKSQIISDLHGRVAGPWNLENLAAYGRQQRD
jgi:hypothetical protein